MASSNREKLLPPSEVLDLWLAYEVAEAGAQRAKKIARLNEFVSRLTEIPMDHWYEWALSLARDHEESGEYYDIRMPLFRAVVFPALKQAIEQRVPGAARRLARLKHLLYQAPNCAEQLPPDLQHEHGLLKLAIEHDPDDYVAVGYLIETMANDLRYNIHAVPSGILVGSRGATIEQCEELQGELNEFRHWVAKAGLEEQYQSLIEQCQLHFHAYPKYLADQERYMSYYNYIASIASQ